ncbi:MAG: SDR family NAD(P)-dependent oxidoreductase [Steroidobacteraceae bacterium]
MSDAFKKFDLSGKTALVTGGGTGIGYYMTRGLMRSGARVMIAARRGEVLEQAAAKLRSESKAGSVCSHTVDLSRRESIKALAEHAIKTLDGVDIFIGNAAQDVFESVEKISDAVIDQLFQVNTSANIELVRVFLPGMRRKKWGRILFSSAGASVAASAQDSMAIYSATKAALNSFARTTAAEAGHDGVTVNSLILGGYITPMMAEHLALLEKTQGREVAKSFTDGFASMMALGRMGRCDEVEGIIQLLASDAGSFITGTSLAVDGGLGIMLRPHTPPEHPVYPPPF